MHRSLFKISLPESFNPRCVAKPSLSTMIVGVCPPKDIFNLRKRSFRLMQKPQKDDLEKAVIVLPASLLGWYGDVAVYGIARILQQSTIAIGLDIKNPEASRV